MPSFNIPACFFLPCFAYAPYLRCKPKVQVQQLQSKSKAKQSKSNSYLASCFLHLHLRFATQIRCISKAKSTASTAIAKQSKVGKNNSKFSKVNSIAQFHCASVAKRLVWANSIKSYRKYVKGLPDSSVSPFFFSQQIFSPDFICRQKINTLMQISHLEKISISYTGKSLVNSSTELVGPMTALELIAAQRCAVVWAGQSVSSWKLRKNSVIGCKVTLRRKSAAHFLEKFYTYVLCANIGEKNSCFLDRCGNIHFGISENSCFHELQKLSSLWTSFSGFSISITQNSTLPMYSLTSGFLLPSFLPLLSLAKNSKKKHSKAYKKQSR